MQAQIKAVPPQHENAKQLIVQFIEHFLQIDFQGFQSGFGIREDQILFRAPSGSTLCVPTSVMLLRQEEARAVIEAKLEVCRKEFNREVA